MKNKLQMTEEQAREIFKEGCRHNFFGKLQDIDKKTEDIWIERIKQAGYICRSVVEEAEEMYHNQYESFGQNVSGEVSKFIEKLYEAIQELKSENERLKCLKP